MDRRSASLLLALSTLAALAVVPDWPQHKLSHPGYWALGGFLLLVVILLARGRGSWRPGGADRRLVLAFLALLPVVYVTLWFRFGGSQTELAVEAAGLILWWALAFMARRSDLVLWFGCVLHGLWDAAHFGRATFTPEWYAAACIAADISLGAFVFIRLKDAPHR